MDAPGFEAQMCAAPNCIIKEQELLEKYNAIVANGKPGYCLVTLSLKHFSEYLHNLGQEKYREVLAAFSQQVTSVLAEGDCLARIHYNYFNLLLACDATLEALHAYVGKIHYAVRDGMKLLFGKQLFLAMGFYPIASPYCDFYDARYFADLSRKGEQYRYRESNYDMYGLSYIDRYEAFRKLESSVQAAMDRGDFKLYLQPKVHLATGEIAGAEALVRWLDPEQGIIPLKDFLPQMEENGYIRDLDCHLFNVACGYMDRWLHDQGKKITISFNLNKAYFNGTFFMPDYTQVFHRYRIPPDCVCIELLESIVYDDKDRLEQLVQEIYDFGFSCALDDFGSGFSTFSVLTSVRLSELKIDRSLFQNYENPKERALIKHIVDIAHDMGMTCVAEGIETKEYVDYLREIGCDFVQGFYFYKPMPVEEFQEKFILS